MKTREIMQLQVCKGKVSENLKEKQDATGYQLQFEKIHANNGTVCWVWQQSTNSVRPD